MVEIVCIMQTNNDKNQMQIRCKTFNVVFCYENKFSEQKSLLLYVHIMVTFFLNETLFKWEEQYQTYMQGTCSMLQADSW